MLSSLTDDDGNSKILYCRILFNTQLIEMLHQAYCTISLLEDSFDGILIDILSV